MNEEFQKRFRNGEEAVFSDIYKQYADMLYGYGMKIVNDPQVVRECIQSVFIYLFDKHKSMVIPENLAGYLVSSMKHLLYKVQRQESIFLSMESELVDKKYIFNLSIDMAATMEDTGLREEQLEALQAALDALSPQQREVIYLRYYKNLSVDETAAVLEISHQTVKNVACTAIARLRKNELLTKVFLLAIACLFVEHIV